MAAGQSPNSANIGIVAASAANTTVIVGHPEYLYYRPEWQKLRDVLAGEREVKRKSTIYLRKLKQQDHDDYLHYLEGAVFYNMTAQTQNGMIGEIFQRDPTFRNLPPKFKDIVRNRFGKDGSGHVGFSKTVISEILSMGRYGVLVDISSQPTNNAAASYAVGYSAENILDWTVEEINGIYQLTRVFLREFSRNNEKGPTYQNPWIGNPLAAAAQNAAGPVRPVSGYIEAFTYNTTYRELFLERQDDGSYVYKQNVYPETPTVFPVEFTPTVRGQTLNFIPFMFFGATSNTADVEKSPLLDIANLNLSHFRTYASLEWGQFFTALPIYYAPGRDDEGASEYAIGPSTVWEVPAEMDPPGIIEYKGQGLGQLQKSLESKERQIAAIGGRLMPGSSAKGGENLEQSKRAAASEQALILNAIQSTEFGMTQVFRWWLMWRDVPLAQTENLQYMLNRMFSDSQIGAREMRVMQQLYNDGIMPIDAVYDFSVKGGWVDPDTSLEEFKALLEMKESFINNPDAQARMRGYSSRQQELDQASVAREADMQQQEIDLQEREVEVIEEAAEEAPPPPPKPPNPDSAANPQTPKGPIAPKPGRGGAIAKAKKPRPGGQGGDGD